MVKTNAMRLLAQAGIEYELIEYEVDEENLAGVHVQSRPDCPWKWCLKHWLRAGKNADF